MTKTMIMTKKEYFERIEYLHEHGPELKVKVRVFIYRIAKMVHAEKLFRKMFGYKIYIVCEK